MIKYYLYDQKDNRRFLFKVYNQRWYKYHFWDNKWIYMSSMRPDELKDHGVIKEINIKQLQFYQAIL